MEKIDKLVNNLIRLRRKVKELSGDIGEVEMELDAIYDELEGINEELSEK